MLGMENTVMASRQKASQTASKTRRGKPGPSGSVPATALAVDGREPASVTNDVAAGRPKATIRFYCQGIGDCHLLRFPKDDGGDFWMLIDCGIHSSITGGTEKIKRIVKNIR